MKILLLVFITFVTLNYPQTFKVEKITGDVKMLSIKNNSWQPLKLNLILDGNTIISTDKNSSIKINNDELSFTLTEYSAITVANIRKMSMDELILALAMESVLNTPRKKGNNNSENTGVYGEKVTGEILETLKSKDFGIKRLNGAKQLAENGMKESAIIAAKEVYRKYPDTKSDASFRIYFADLLYERGLYEEAFSEYKETKLLQLNNEQALSINDKIEQISKKLLRK